MNHKKLFWALLLITVGVASMVGIWFTFRNSSKDQVREASSQLSATTPVVSEEKNTPTQKLQNPDGVLFAGREYVRGYTAPSQGTDYVSQSAEWVTNGETVDNWTSLITTHHLKSTSQEGKLSAEAYSQNVIDLNKQNGALILETSVISQDAETLGISQDNPPYLLVYMYVADGTTEFNMQKIFQISPTEIGSVIYAERFPTKTEEEMKAYYDSQDRADKRIELIKSRIPLEERQEVSLVEKALLGTWVPVEKLAGNEGFCGHVVS